MEQRPSLHLSVVAIEKRAFRSPSAKVANFFFYLTFTFYISIIDILDIVKICSETRFSTYFLRFP